MGTPIIEALDHIRIEVDADHERLHKTVADYEAVLGHRAAGMRLQLANISVELGQQRTVAEEEQTGPATDCVVSLMFATKDIGEAMRRLGRRGLAGAIGADGRASVDRQGTHGVSIGLVERKAAASGERAAEHDIVGLDHVVVRTPDPERAVALYGGRLGLDLRLDRTNPERGNRLLFFVCGNLVVEISHDTRKGVRPGLDGIWGMAWRSDDIERSHARMSAAGVAVSEIRTGNRPGTRVFTVKSHTAGVPTLVIGGHGLERR